MSEALSANAKAILLLTAPLIVSRRAPGGVDAKPLSLKREYNRLAKRLREIERTPADLLGAKAGRVLDECLGGDESAVERLDRSRVEALLGRGMQLSLAVEKWRARAIWVLSRADDEYPGRLKLRLGAGAASELLRAFQAEARPLLRLPLRAVDVADTLGVTRWQAERWLERWVREGSLTTIAKR